MGPALAAGGAEAYLLRLAALPRWGAKLRCAAQRVFPPSEFLRGWGGIDHSKRGWLARAYAYRAIWCARRLPVGVRRWLRASRTASGIRRAEAAMDLLKTGGRSPGQRSTFETSEEQNAQPPRPGLGIRRRHLLGKGYFMSLGGFDPDVKDVLRGRRGCRRMASARKPVARQPRRWCTWEDRASLSDGGRATHFQRRKPFYREKAGARCSTSRLPTSSAPSASIGKLPGPGEVTEGAMGSQSPRS